MELARYCSADDQSYQITVFTCMIQQQSNTKRNIRENNVQNMIGSDQVEMINSTVQTPYTGKLLYVCYIYLVWLWYVPVDIEVPCSLG